GTGFGFTGEWAKLDTPDRAILSYATGDAELLSQLLLVLLRTSLIANGPDLHHKVAAGALRGGLRCHHCRRGCRRCRRSCNNGLWRRRRFAAFQYTRR